MRGPTPSTQRRLADGLVESVRCEVLRQLDRGYGLLGTVDVRATLIPTREVHGHGLAVKVQLVRPIPPRPGRRSSGVPLPMGPPLTVRGGPGAAPCQQLRAWLSDADWMLRRIARESARA